MFFAWFHGNKDIELLQIQHLNPGGSGAGLEGEEEACECLVNVC